jgi:glycosyltransferase involved in cell wall biosynthesis
MFSVILCTYNRAHLIKRAIDSLLAQTYPDWELIIVDDGSRDDTFTVIKDIVASDPRIRYHYSDNQGQSAARNLGFSMTTMRYVTFLDSDDEYLPDHLQKRFDILSYEPAIELLHGGVEVVGEAMVVDKNDLSKQISLSECVIGGTFFIRRDLWTRIGGFDDILYSDDSDFFDRAKEAGAYIKKVEYPTYRYYRTESDSLCAISEREGVEGILRFRNS